MVPTWSVDFFVNAVDVSRSSCMSCTSSQQSKAIPMQGCSALFGHTHKSIVCANRSDQIILHLFQPHQADQMFDPDLGFILASTFDINDIMLKYCINCPCNCAGISTKQSILIRQFF